MGLLEDLRNEAAIKASHTFLEEDTLENKDLIYKEEILPKMQEIFFYMSEIIEHIKYLDYDIDVYDYSKEYPQFGKLRQKNYKINTDGRSGFVDIDNLEQINISFECQGIGSFRIQKEGQFQIESQIAFFHQKKIDFYHTSIPSSSGKKTVVFEIQRKVPITLRFVIDKQNSVINLFAYNYNNFETQKKSYKPYEINKALLEKIAKHLLRQENDLFKLPISESHITNIRQKLKYLELEKNEIIRHNNKEKTHKVGGLKNLLKNLI